MKEEGKNPFQAQSKNQYYEMLKVDKNTPKCRTENYRTICLMNKYSINCLQTKVNNILKM